MFAISSLTEGLPIALLEAMEARVPIVATRVGGIPEVLQNGEAGLLIGPSQPQALTESLIYLFQNDEAVDQIVRTAYQKLISQFSVEAMAMRYLRVYKNVLNRNMAN